MLSAIVLAVPDLAEAAKTGDQSFFWIIRAVVPQPLRTTLYVGISVAMYLCGLSTLTSASRMVYAFARDGGLPFSRKLSHVGSHHTPSVAIWTVAGLAIIAARLPYAAVAAVCTVFLDIAYLLPTLLGLFAYGRGWKEMGPWSLGAWYRPLAALAVAGCVGIIFISVQPPSEIALPIVGTMAAILVALWWGWMRRHFPGLPMETPPAETPSLAANVGE
jgi:amino acid transporter